MGVLRKMMDFFGLLKDENREKKGEDNDEEKDHANQEETRQHRPTKGFSVQVPVPVPVHVDRPAPHLGPILSPCHLGQGGLQGLRWHAKHLKMDEDGDVAEEFLDEVLPEVSGTDTRKSLPKFAVRCSTRPVNIRKQIITNGGNFLQSFEHKGSLQWV